MELNHNTPWLPVWVRNEFLFNQTRGHGELTEGQLFGITSLRQRALMFNVMTITGAHWRWLPAHALLHTKIIPKKLYDLPDLQLWDCFSNNVTVIQWEYLRGHECLVALRNRDVVRGRYAFTVDWLPETHLDTTFVTEAEQSKCGHVILLDNGQIAIQPTNRINWLDSYFIGNEPIAAKQGYLTNTHQWVAETCERWSVAKDERQFYGTEEKL